MRMQEIQQNEQGRIGRTIGFIVVLLAVAIVARFIFTKDRGDDSTTVNVNGVTVQESDAQNIVVERVPERDTTLQAPGVERVAVFPEDFPSEAKAIWNVKFEQVKQLIAESPYSYEGWNGLGLLRDMIADYAGAREAWEYAADLYPSDSVLFQNLGFLYGYHLSLPGLAEEHFLKGIENSPSSAQAYTRLFEFYRDILRDTAKARSIAEEGKTQTNNAEYFDQLITSLE